MDWGSRRLPRRVIAWIAMGAVLLLLVRPACELWHATSLAAGAPASELTLSHDTTGAFGAQGSGDAPCCPDASNGFVVTLVKVLASGGAFNPAPIAPPYVPIALVVLTLFAVVTIRWPRPARPRCPSFYLRSARILR